VAAADDDNVVVLPHSVGLRPRSVRCNRLAVIVNCDRKAVDKKRKAAGSEDGTFY
jgi:hypothetical protein